jgi:hypothetical protein
MPAQKKASARKASVKAVKKSSSRRSPSPKRTKKTEGLKPCPPGKERNPLTNRCRKIAAKPVSPKPKPVVSGKKPTATKPCPPGKERNPLTNRCRKIAAKPVSPRPSPVPLSSPKPLPLGFKQWLMAPVFGAKPVAVPVQPAQLKPMPAKPLLMPVPAQPKPLVAPPMPDMSAFKPAAAAAIKHLGLQDIMSLYQQKNPLLAKSISDRKDVKLSFNRLLFTHNTSIPTFINMLTGVYNNIRCCNTDGSPYGLGAQFRYGIDSQYGEVKMVMKDEFWRFCSRGVNKSKTLENAPVFADIFGDQWMTYSPATDGAIKDLLKQNANSFTFRNYIDREHIGRSIGYIHCNNPDVRTKPTWCNIQLHLGCPVDFDHVLYVIVPGFLKNYKLPGMSTTFDTLVSRSILKDKVLYSDNISPDQYYSFINEGLFTEPFYADLRSKYPRLKTDSGFSIDEYTRRIGGNSSQLSTSLKAFEPEEILYMMILLNYHMEIATPLVEPAPITTAPGKDGVTLRVGSKVRCSLYDNINEGVITRFRVDYRNVTYVVVEKVHDKGSESWSQPAKNCELIA